MYLVLNIEGEYAILADCASKETLFIAMALLPGGTDVGDFLLYKDFEYQLLYKNADS